MNKNHMKEVAAILGLELGEEFKTKTDGDTFGKGTHYRITEEELEYFNTVYGEWESATGIMYKFLLGGKSSIIKKPWKPKNGEEYFIPITTSGKGSCTFTYWLDCKTDMNLYKANMVCKTEEEAVKKAECMLQALKKYNEMEE